MKLSILSLAIATTVASTSVFAAEIYKDQSTRVNLNAEITLGAQGSKTTDEGIEQLESKVGFEIEHALTFDSKVFSEVEWDLNLTDENDDALKTSLGYIGYKHDKLGALTLGTQWSQYYKAGGVTDLPVAFSNDFLRDKSLKLGVGKASNMAAIETEVALDPLGKYGTVNFGAAYQGATTLDAPLAGGVDIGSRIQATVGYSVDLIELNYAFLGAEIKDNPDASVVSNLLSAKYGTYGEGVYLAGVVAQDENLQVDPFGQTLENSQSIELLGSYGFPNKLNISINYEAVMAGDDTRGTGYDGERVSATSAIQAEYDFTPRFKAYAGYEFDLKGTGQFDYYQDKDNKWAVGAKLYL
ncbi:porin [Vibrio mediterranei]|uniref:porin n=1 Tax=Vibrio mediterranei TaxID=689 RepID=UPI0040680A4E